MVGGVRFPGEVGKLATLSRGSLPWVDHLVGFALQPLSG